MTDKTRGQRKQERERRRKRERKKKKKVVGKVNREGGREREKKGEWGIERERKKNK